MPERADRPARGYTAFGLTEYASGGLPPDLPGLADAGRPNPGPARQSVRVADRLASCLRRPDRVTWCATNWTVGAWWDRKRLRRTGLDLGPLELTWDLDPVRRAREAARDAHRTPGGAP